MVVSVIKGNWGRLSANVTPINYDIGASSVSRSITSQVQIHSLQLPRICITLHWSQAKPGFFGFERTVTRNRRICVARRDSVHPGKVRPLHSERLGKVYDTCFASVIASLLDVLEAHNSFAASNLSLIWMSLPAAEEH